MKIFQLQCDGPVGEAIEKISVDYKGTAVVLSTFSPKVTKWGGPLKVGNIYSRFALGNAYRTITNEDVGPIRPRESEIALANNTLTDPRNISEDLGLIVYPNKGYNENIWRYLREQTQANFQDVDLRQPFVVTGLMDFIRDDKFENNLRPDFNELTLVYNVPILNEETGKFSSEDKELQFSSEDKELQKTGFPSKLGQGDRTLYFGKNGVRRFYRRRRDLNLDAACDALAVSIPDGRVHFIENFSSGNLDGLLAELEKENPESK